MNSESLSKEIGEILVKQNKVLSVAESCTGGLLSGSITCIPGSSAYFSYGIVSYSNDAKKKLLGVEDHFLKFYGAVSREVVLEMAKGVRELSSSDYSLAVTGIAGPTGATINKPVGLVYIGFSSDKVIDAEKIFFKGNRQEIRNQTVIAALQFLLKSINKRTND